MHKKGWKGLGIAAGVLVLIAGIAAFSMDPDEGKGARFHAGTFKANNSLTTVSSHRSSDSDFFQVRRVAIVVDSQHPLIKRSARKLADTLGALPYIDTVEVLGMEGQEPGGLLYDLYIVMEMPTFKSRGWLATGRTVNAEIHCSVGRGLWNARQGHTDPLSPALVDPYISITLDHESTGHGVESPNARWTQVVDDVSQQLGNAITKPLNTFAAEHPAPAALPSGLYPAYHPRPALPAPWNARLKEVINGHGFLAHNQSVFILESTHPYEDLKATRDLLVERGWRMNSKRFEKGDKHNPYYYRGTFENLVSEAFEARALGPRATNEAVRLVFRYSERMKQNDLAAVFEAEYGEGAIPLDVWLGFQRVLPEAMNERMLESLAAQPQLPVAAERRLIRHLHKTGRQQEAMARLRPAYLSALIAGSDEAKQIVKLGRELKEDKDWEPEAPTAAEFMGLGLHRLAPGESIDVEVGLHEYVRFLVGSDDELEVFSARVEASAIPEGRYTLASGSYRISNAARSASSVTPHSKDIPWRSTLSDHGGGQSLHVSAEELDPDRFKLTIEGRR